MSANNSLTPPCFVCGDPTQGEYFNSRTQHFCNRCGQMAEGGRFSKWAGIWWRILRRLLALRRALRS